MRHDLCPAHKDERMRDRGAIYQERAMPPSVSLMVSRRMVASVVPRWPFVAFAKSPFPPFQEGACSPCSLDSLLSYSVGSAIMALGSRLARWSSTARRGESTLSRSPLQSLRVGRYRPGRPLSRCGVLVPRRLVAAPRDPELGSKDRGMHRTQESLGRYLWFLGQAMPCLILAVHVVVAG